MNNVLRKKDVCLRVGDRWREQYGTGTGWEKDESKQLIQAELDALRVSEMTEGRIAEIIGNESWTRLECDNCGRDVDEIVSLGKRHGFVNICERCVMGAVDDFECS